MHIDFGAAVDRLDLIQVHTALERTHGTCQQFRVKRKPHLVDLTALRLTQQLAGPAYLEIMRRQRKSCP